MTRIIWHYFAALHNHKVLLIVCFAFIISLHRTVQAQKDTVNLKEIEVIGLKPDVSSNSPNPVQEITIKKLNALPATSVADAIRNFSGVTVKDFGGIGGLKTVMIRSLGANHTAVFVDGLPNHDAATGQIDLGRISLQDVGNITLSIGQPEFELTTARMYASAGILEVKSRIPDFGDKRNLLNLSLRTGSFGTFNPSLGFNRKWSDKATSGIRINHYSSNGKFPYEIHNGASIDEKTRQNSDIVSTDAVFRSVINFKDSSSLNLKASWYHSVRGLPGAVIYYNPYSAQRLNNDDFIAGLQYKTKPGKKYRFLVSGGFSDIRLLYKDPNFQNQTGGISNEYNQKEFYLSDAASYQIGSNLVASVATDVIYNSLNSNAYSIGNPVRLSSLTVAAIQWSGKQTEIQTSALLSAIKDASDENVKNSYSKLLPAISVIHNITNDRTLKARFSIKQAMRMPSFNDMYYYLAGNINVKPENALMLDGGLLFAKSFSQMTGINLRLNGFFNKVSNKIVVLPTQNLFIWSTRNIGKVDVKGLEVVGGIVKHISENWSFDLSGNYTYQEAKDVTNKTDATYGYQVAYIPYETAGAIATIYYRNISAGANFLYNGFRYSNNYNLPSNLMSSWATTDLTISWEKALKEHKLKVKGEVINLFNKNYEVIRSFPMTGRSFYVNLYLTI